MSQSSILFDSLTRYDSLYLALSFYLNTLLDCFNLLEDVPKSLVKLETISTSSGTNVNFLRRIFLFNLIMLILIVLDFGFFAKGGISGGIATI
jgi:hypothetical protein